MTVGSVRQTGQVLAAGDDPQISSEIAKPIFAALAPPGGDPLGVMVYVKYPLSLGNVEALLFERGIDICHEAVRMWWDGHCQSNAAAASGR